MRELRTWCRSRVVEIGRGFRALNGRARRFSNSIMDMTHLPQSRQLALNGVLLILVGLFGGIAVAGAPFPRLMLTAHIQFMVNGMVSIFAALLLQSALSTPKRGVSLIVWGHYSLWLVCLSEVAGAFWGSNKTLPIAAAQAGAPGSEAWQEALIKICHVIPSLLLIVAWALLLQGTAAHKSRN